MKKKKKIETISLKDMKRSKRYISNLSEIDIKLLINHQPFYLKKKINTNDDSCFFKE
jgi:hypothetical protein